MYSIFTHINILTDLLLQHGVHHAVLCPGSQNAPLVHNFCQCGQINCIPATDERSAGFVAMGMALQLRQPVVVCVTSGSALLGLLPAVAEAFYQHIPLVVISADRAPERIGQLDGQTLPQPDALRPFVQWAVNLPQEGAKHQARLVNEALLATKQGEGGPVHINVPISGQIHRFDTPRLAPQQCICRTSYSRCSIEANHPLSEHFIKARRRLVVVGQLPYLTAQSITPLLQQLHSSCVILHDCLGAEAFLPAAPEAFRTPTQQDFAPDFILYLGGNLVDKSMNRWLQQLQAPCWVANRSGALTEVAGRLVGVVEAGEMEVLEGMAHLKLESDSHFLQAWHERLHQGCTQAAHTALEWSQALVVRTFEAHIAALQTAPIVCYANSSAVRLANLFATAHRQCNRGLNGIEGSLSTAAGMAMAAPHQLIFCVIGDLSFFYDHNALWLQNLGPNLRILLLNNAGGGIFARFSALQSSPALDRFIMARHTATAQGICSSFGIRHMEASCTSELLPALHALCAPHADAPLLLEVHTCMETDQHELTRLGTPPEEK